MSEKMTFEHWWSNTGRGIFQRSETYKVAQAAWDAARALSAPASASPQPEQHTSGNAELCADFQPQGPELGSPCVVCGRQGIEHAALSAAQPQAREGHTALYMELLYAVARKCPGETRHQTALRYIRLAEEPVHVAAKSDASIGSAMQADRVKAANR